MKNNQELVKQAQEATGKDVKFGKNQNTISVQPSKTNRVGVQFDWAKCQMAISH